MILGLFLALLVFSASAQSYDCPTSHITPTAGTTGSLPSGATSMVHLPKGYECLYTFDIPAGYALKVETSTVYQVSSGDFVQFESFFISSGVSKATEYAIQGQSPFHIKSVSGNLQFFATYEFLDVTGYQKETVNTGNFFKTTLKPNSYYTMEPTAGDNATISLGSLNTGTYDNSIYEVMVFDGPNVVDSVYIGRLDQVLKYHRYPAITSEFTFLNLYGTPSSSYVLGNDWSKVKNIEQYRVGVIDPVKTLAYMAAEQYGRNDAYYTYFCDGCDAFYIETVAFDTQRISDPSGYVEISMGSPTQGLAPIIKYPFSEKSQSPKYQILGNMATFHTYKAAVTFSFRASK